MKKCDAPNIRRMESGSWYWIDKALIRNCAPIVGTVGIAVYNCLASFANAKQTCYPSQGRIAEMLGCSRATVNRTIKKLEASGLVAVERGGRYPQLYHLLPVRCNSGEALLSNMSTWGVTPVHTNNTNRTRYMNNISRADIDIHRDVPRRGGGLQPAIETEPLALEVAEVFNDRKNLRQYMFYCRKYPESLIRRALVEVNETPCSRIKKSRAALFKYLIRVYAEQSNHNSSD